MGTLLQLLFARRSAGQALDALASRAATDGLSLSQWRGLVAKVAESGDLDAIYQVHVTRMQKKAQAYIDGGKT